MTPQDHGFDDLVADVTPRVLADALEQATDRARDELTDRLTRAIVTRALGSARAMDTGTTEDTDEPARTGLYAFAIVPAGPVDLAGLAGIDGAAPLRVVQHSGLGLVVSHLRLDLLDEVSEDDLSETGPLATLARRHDAVIRSVFDHGPVLPLRFGTVVADEDDARRLLADQSVPARRRLAHLGTHREWGVRLSREGSAEGGAEARADETGPGRRQEMTGTSYLAARREVLQRSQRAEQERAAIGEHVEQQLRGHAVDVVHRGGGAESLADVAYLVAADDEVAFLDAVERLSREVADHDVLLETTGPWPPYSFAKLDEESAGGVAGSA